MYCGSDGTARGPTTVFTKKPTISTLGVNSAHFVRIGRVKNILEKISWICTPGPLAIGIRREFGDVWIMSIDGADFATKESGVIAAFPEGCTVGFAFTSGCDTCRRLWDGGEGVVVDRVVNRDGGGDKTDSGKRGAEAKAGAGAGAEVGVGVGAGAGNEAGDEAEAEAGEGE